MHIYLNNEYFAATFSYASIETHCVIRRSNETEDNFGKYFNKLVETLTRVESTVNTHACIFS